MKYNLLTLEHHHQEMLEVAITISEIDFAVDNMKLGESPGADGFSIEFYKKFKEQLSSKLQQVFSSCL